MTDALTERQMEAVELILAAALQSPAMADELIIVTRVMVKPPTIPGKASGNSTCQIM